MDLLGILGAIFLLFLAGRTVRTLAYDGRAVRAVGADPAAVIAWGLLILFAAFIAWLNPM